MAAAREPVGRPDPDRRAAACGLEEEAERRANAARELEGEEAAERRGDAEHDLEEEAEWRGDAAS